MGLLADTKRRRKLGKDPNNTKWTSDTSNFGQNMLRSQGWEPGQYLGARDVKHAELHTAANAASIRVSLKDDVKGLGFNRAQDDEVKGLDVFSDLLSRLNGRSEEEVEGVKKARLEMKTNAFVERRWGTIRFVRGGLLVGDALKREEIRLESGEARAAEEGEPASDEGDAPRKKKKKSKKRKIDDADEGEADDHDAEKCDAPQKEKKSKKRKTEEADDEEVDSDARERKRRRAERRARRAAAESATDGPEDTGTRSGIKTKRRKRDKVPASEQETNAAADQSEGTEDIFRIKTGKSKSKARQPEAAAASEASTKAEKRSKKDKKEKKSKTGKDETDRGRRRKDEEEDETIEKQASSAGDDTLVALSTAAAVATEATASSAAISGTSTPVGGRNFARARFLAAKRQAMMDSTAMKQIFMVKT